MAAVYNGSCRAVCKFVCPCEPHGDSCMCEDEGKGGGVNRYSSPSGQRSRPTVYFGGSQDAASEGVRSDSMSLVRSRMLVRFLPLLGHPYRSASAITRCLCSWKFSRVTKASFSFLPATNLFMRARKHGSSIANLPELVDWNAIRA
jgi:hypothetical protein